MSNTAPNSVWIRKWHTDFSADCIDFTQSENEAMRWRKVHPEISNVFEYVQKSTRDAVQKELADKTSELLQADEQIKLAMNQSKWAHKNWMEDAKQSQQRAAELMRVNQILSEVKHLHEETKARLGDSWIVAEKLRAELDRKNAEIASFRHQTFQAEAERDAALAKLKVMREALEPSGDTKAAYIGEFSFSIPKGEDEEGNEIREKVYVPWDQIKEIMAAIRKRAALNQKGTI